MKTTYRDTVVSHQGMGGFLNPPGHPAHTHSVLTEQKMGGRWRKEGGMSIESAAKDSSSVSDECRAECLALLAAWEANKPPLTDPTVNDWVLQVMGYFRGCYADKGSYNVSDLTIDKKRHDDCVAEGHAGVRLVRQYYPDFQPQRQHFLAAYWGQKPGAKLVEGLK